MNRSRLHLTTCLGVAALLYGASPASAQPIVAVAPDLGAAAPYAVLGVNGTPVAGTVTCTGPGTINGDVGTTFAPGTIVNTPPCTINGSVGLAGPGVVSAFNSAFSAIDTQNPNCTGTIPITTQTLAPGVYCSPAGTTIPSGVIITLQGNASDVWVFRVGTTLGALTVNGQVVMGGSALACNVYWKTSAAATFTSATFNGTVLSGAAVSATSTNWVGRAMARTDVTLTNPTMSFAGCSRPATITVNKDFIPNNPASVPVALTCTSGTVTTAPPTFSEAAPAVFTVGGASLAGATCTATETVPAGYTANQSNCAAVALGGACTIINTQTAPPGCPAITLAPTTVPNGIIGNSYNVAITASGGSGSYTFAATTGTLPPGLTLTAAGVLAGTPTTAGTFTFTVRGTDSNGTGCFGERSYTIIITAPPPGGCPVITIPGALPNASVGVAYSHTLTATGGTGPYTFSVAPGTLPAGLTLTPGGVLSGTPTVANPQTFTIRATDANGCFVERTFTMTVVNGTPPLPGCPAITLDPTTIPNGVVGVAYSQTITAVGAVGPVTFTRTAGSTFPSGLLLTSSGVTATLAGTPTVVILADDFTIRATDANGCFAELNYKIAILAGVPTLPQLFIWMLALTLIWLGYRQLQRRQRPNAD